MIEMYQNSPQSSIRKITFYLIIGFGFFFVPNKSLSIIMIISEFLKNYKFRQNVLRVDIFSFRNHEAHVRFLDQRKKS